MSYQELTLPSKDGYRLSLRIYETDNPKAVVKVIHGMQEYQDRYRAFAEYLQAAGYTVITADLRGHGPNAPALSHIADRDGHLRLQEDEEAILEEIRRRWPGMPVILFTHSMGTILGRVLLQKHSREFEKVVLSSYPNPNSAAGAASVLTDVLALFKGAKGYSKLVDGMVTEPFSKAVPGAKTPTDWLSVDEENVRKYNEDPLCGVRFTLGSYNTLFRLLRLMDKPERYENVRKDLPILMISGADDPCTGGEEGRTGSVDRLEQAGFDNLTVITIDGMRHEILNEAKKEDVYRTIMEFIEK